MESPSNDEIFRRLTQEFKVKCGPVTDSTRRVYLKQLQKYVNENKRNVATVPTNDNDHQPHHHNDRHQEVLVISNNYDGGDRLANGSNGHHEPSNNQNDSFEVTEPVVIQSVRRRSSSRNSPKKKTIEELDAINSFNEVDKQIRKKNSSPRKTLKTSIVRKVNLNEVSASKLNNYSSESSEDDDDNSINQNLPPPQSSFHSSRIASPRIFNGETYKAPLARSPIRRINASTHVEKKGLSNYSDSESEFDDTKNDKLCQLLMSHRPGLGGRLASVKVKQSLFTKISSWFANLKSKFNRSQPDYNGSPSSTPLSSSINFSSSSNYISFALVMFVVTFFIFIFSVYFYAKFTLNTKNTVDLNDYAFIDNKSKLVASVCADEFKCLQFDSDRKPALNMVKEIKGYIDQAIRRRNCESNDPLQEITDFSFRTNEISKNLDGNVDSFITEREKILTGNPHHLFFHDFNNALKLIKNNPSWNMVVDESGFDETLKLSPQYRVQFPLKCNLWLFWNENLFTIIVTLVALAFPLISYFIYRRSKHVASEEQALVYDLIEKSIELLQSPDEPQSMPVLHIRDTLLSPSERKSTKFRRIWNRVVNHIENSESRVKVEFKKIDGEDFKAWKWIAANASSFMNDTDGEIDGHLGASTQTQKIGGVEWQGQAFGSSLTAKGSSTIGSDNSGRTNVNVSPSNFDIIRAKNYLALTRFMKIRNILEKEAHHSDPNWSTKIKNTILEKTAANSPTGTHDIVHIEIEDNSNEGLVFLKCATIEGATSAFHALHGWWCEKKLVSVKFLKEERYNLRFPHAKDATTPLVVAK
ncbi:hypothetical protein RDWZM_006995 [Blomia tropicalis]|uniref:LEM domain-containing protein n=1 Tax=Blomia tropicalis TaxID=40697 RepID=A0A9Q0RMA1_BLOTA|nr:LEM domain [Blomia tropicalis]KAJ6221183.1 hypothetical protein RDWZM_006995 [Blomia tropicalis]